MCECNNFPVPHHAGWCALEAHPVSDKAWNEFERLTVSQWAGH
jgi:hypothetical protein